MAFNVFFTMIENDEEFQTKSAPWRCDYCRRDKKILLKITIDYDTLILCKQCLMGAKRLITDKEKESKDGENSINN